jgi:hypothetical protein
LQIGAGIDGDSAKQFASIAGVHRLGNGVIAVLDAWAPALSFFDSAGVVLGRIGRWGTGPGEFPGRTGSIRHSLHCGTDTVFVFVERRIAAYVPPGHYVRTFQLEPPSWTRNCARDRFVGELWRTNFQREPGLSTDSVEIALYDRDGAFVSALDTVPGEDRSWIRGVEGVGYSRAVFGRRLALTARDSMIAVGFPASFEIEIRSSVGAVLRVIRVLGRERRVGSADVEQFRGYVVNPYRGNEQELRQLEEHLDQARDKLVPAFAEFRFDRAGNLWVRQYDHLDAVEFYDYSALNRRFARPTIETPRRWAVLDPDGRYLGDVDIPPGFTVHEIGDTWILGVWRAALDIPYVRLYTLIKPRTAFLSGMTGE